MQGVPCLSGTDPVKKMKRLIFFAKHMEIGGLEKALLNLLNSLARYDYQVTLVLEEKRGAFLRELDDRIELREYRLSACPIKPLRRALNLIKRLLWRWKNAGKYDFSCAYCTYSVIGSRLAQYASPNSCLYVHSDYAVMYPEEEDYRRFFDELQVSRFRRLVFVSQKGREDFCGSYPELSGRSLVINNLVNPEEIRRKAKEPAECPVRPGETVFVFAGRLEESTKRLSRLLEAFALARMQRQDLRLLMVGDGPDRPLCEESIEKLALQDAVTMLGAQPNPYPFMALGDCVVLSSDQEGFPMVYYEALILNRDIITTVPVSDELMDIRQYAVVTEKTPEALAQAMVNYRRGGGKHFDAEALNRQRLESLISVIENRT